MTFGAAEGLARALLYEGYVLYPYRASSLKNRQRWAFGSLFPPEFAVREQAGDAVLMRTECLVSGDAPRIRVSVRFLQLGCSGEGPSSGSVALVQAVERRIDPPPALLTDLEGEEVSVLVRYPRGAIPPCADRAFEASSPMTPPLDASVSLSATRLRPGLFRLRVDVRNESATESRSSAAAHGTPEPGEDRGSERRAAQLRSLVSTHTLLHCDAGDFVSLLEPEEALSAYAKECGNQGAWPVLVGAPGARDVLLSSPVILYDYPCIAAESAGDLFDSTEIDEILTLRILTLSDAEQREIRQTGGLARALLERTQALGAEDLLRLHGAWRPATDASPAPTHTALGAGDRVVIRPHPGGDVMDLALAGEAATVVKVEEDLEGRLHYAVTVDCDPGRDLGAEGQPGHRFFFSREELERRP